MSKKSYENVNVISESNFDDFDTENEKSHSMID